MEGLPGGFGVWVIAASLVRVDPTGSPVRDGQGVSLGMFSVMSLCACMKCHF